MPTQTELFEDFISQALNANRYRGSDPSIVQFLEQSRRYATAVHSFPTTKQGAQAAYVDIADLALLNAFAFRYHDFDMIGFCSGCALVIDSLFQQILGNPNTFPDVGNPASETASVPRLSIGPRVTDIGTLPAEPTDNARQLIRNLLSKFAKDFLVAHEIAHLRFAHVRYSLANTGQSLIAEYVDSGSDNGDGIISQAFEMNADSFAVAQGLDNLFVLAENVANTLGEHALADHLRDPAWVSGLWVYAVYSLFRLLAASPFDVTALATGSHPPARVRQMWIIQTVLTRCHAGLVPLSVPTALQICLNTAGNVENDFATITASHVDATGLATAQDPAVDAHLSVLRERWAAIRPQLENDSYGTELAE